MIYSISKILYCLHNMKINQLIQIYSLVLSKGIILIHLFNLLRRPFKLFLGNFPYYWKFILITFSFPLLNFCWYVSTSFCFIDFLRKEVIEATWLDIFLLIYVWDYLDLIKIVFQAGVQSYQREQRWLCSLKSMVAQ